jgi:hypothetical protein
MMKTILSLLMAICLSHPMAAQGAKDESVVFVRFAYLAKSAQTPETLLVLTSDGIANVEISSRSPREYHKIRVEDGVVLGTRGETEEQPIIPIARGAPPAGAKKLTALLVPMGTGETYRVLFLDEAGFKPGCVFFINNTAKAIGVTIDKKRFLLKGRSQQLFALAAGEKSRNVYCSFHMEENTGDGGATARLLNESTWNISRERAEICVFYYDESVNRIKSRGMSVFFPPPAESGE